MKRVNTALMSSLIATALALTANSALAGHPGAKVAWARVIDAQPIYQSVQYPVDEQVCWDEQVWRRDPAYRSATPVIIGSIIGGVIGNQFGGGSGRVAMTAAGAALGGSVAADASHRRNPDGYYAVTEQRCRVETNWRSEQRVVAWDVAYELYGEVYRTRLKEQPGKRIRVRVDVSPYDY